MQDRPTTRRAVLAGGIASLAAGAATAQAASPPGTPQGGALTMSDRTSTGEPFGQALDVRGFGARGDGKADDTASIQAAIDAAIARKIQTVYLPEGQYLTSDTLHLGYGETFHQISLVGPTRGAYAGSLTGAAILAQKADRPCLNVQGGRNVTIRGIAFKGRLQPHIGRVLSSEAGYSANPRDYLDAALSPTGLDRFRPYAGITIDAYAGPRPHDGYPDVKLPARIAAGGQYNKRYSSGVIIEACEVQGFAVGVACQPCDADGNGDFLRIRDCILRFCVYGVAICNGQSRNVELRNINYAECHTFLTNGHFGKSRGELGGPIDNISGGVGYQFLDIAAAGFAASVRVSNAYVERQVRIGRYGGGAAWPAPIVFDSCLFSFGDPPVAQGGTGHTPTAALEYFSSVPVTFRQCQFVNFDTLLVPVRFQGHIVNANTPPVHFENCNFVRPTSAASGTSPAMAQAINWFGGAFTPSLVSRGTSVAGAIIGTYFPRGRHDQRPAARPLTSTALLGGERQPLSPTAREIRDILGRSLRIISEPFVATVDARAFHEPLALAGRALSGSYRAQFMEHPNMWMAYEIEAGDLLFVPASGLLFVVMAIARNAGTGHYRLEAQLANGIRHLADGSAQPLTPFEQPPLIHIIKTGVMLPGGLYFGDFTAGATTIANVHIGDGNARELSKHVFPGDRLPETQRPDPALSCPTRPRTRIVSVTDGTPGMIEMSRPALMSGRFPILPVLVS